MCLSKIYKGEAYFFTSIFHKGREQYCIPCFGFMNRVFQGYYEDPERKAVRLI